MNSVYERFCASGKPDKHHTLTFIGDRDRILLGYKKQGFGLGRWNGFGGKVMAGETPLTTAIRETEEECGLIPTDLQLVARLDFLLPDQPHIIVVHVFLGEQSIGEARESNEMRPQWYNKEAIPYPQMWSDDILWLPHILSGHRLRAWFVLNDHDQVIDHHLHFHAQQ